MRIVSSWSGLAWGGGLDSVAIVKELIPCNNCCIFVVNMYRSRHYFFVLCQLSFPVGKFLSSNGIICLIIHFKVHFSLNKIFWPWKTRRLKILGNSCHLPLQCNRRFCPNPDSAEIQHCCSKFISEKIYDFSLVLLDRFKELDIRFNRNNPTFSALKSHSLETS